MGLRLEVGSDVRGAGSGDVPGSPNLTHANKFSAAKQELLSAVESLLLSGIVDSRIETAIVLRSDICAKTGNCSGLSIPAVNIARIQ